MNKKFQKTLQAIDIFSKPIRLKFKNKEIYSTVCDGIISLLTVTIIVIFSIYRLNGLVNRLESIIITTV